MLITLFIVNTFEQIGIFVNKITFEHFLLKIVNIVLQSYQQ